MADKRAEIIAQAEARLGVPYRLDPPPDGIHTLDCSLYVLQVAKSVGLPYPAGVRTAEQIRQASIPITFDEVLPGDLLFFENTYPATGLEGPDGHLASHVGISKGKGTMLMLNAVEPVSVVSHIGSKYWQDKILPPRRIPGLGPSVESVEFSARIPGLDISNHQGTVSWPKIKEAGQEFVFIKASEGKSYVDPFFARNWAGAKSQNIVRGAYHFARPEYGNDAYDEAQFFLEYVDQSGGIEVGDVPILDIESKHTRGDEATADWVSDWLEEVEHVTGLRPLVYTGAWVADFSSKPTLANYDLWLAAYSSQLPKAPKPWTHATFWQYTDKGNVAGINPVDQNWYLDSEVPLRDWAKSLDGSTGHVPDQFVVGTGIRRLMANDNTAPAANSTFLPLGKAPAQIEEGYAENGNRYAWHLDSGKWFRYKPS